MLLSHRIGTSSLRATLIVGLFALLIGCQQTDPIFQYEVPKDPPQDRMIVGIGLHQSSAWFFKLAGERELVDEVESQFDRFLSSIKFAEGSDEPPSWESPEEWNELEASGFRVATLEISDDLEVSISKLGYSGDKEGYLRMNVDRWRREMGLRAVPTSKSILGELTKADLEVGEFFVLQLEGTYSGGASAAPFAGRGGATSEAGNTSPPSRPSPGGSIEFDAPQGWTEVPAGSNITKLKLVFSADSGTAQITLTDLAAAANTWQGNVARWVNLLGTPPLSNEQLEAATESVEIDGVASQMIRLPIDASGTEERGIVAVMTVHGDLAWFVRMSGDGPVIDAQLANFREFLTTLRLP